MRNRFLWTLCFLLAGLPGAETLKAENITGTILIKRKLTRRSVTPVVSSYQRGPAVELGRDGKDTEQDPLSFERSHVAIWLEGSGPASHPALSMQQLNRRFSPDLLVAPVGSTVSFPNMDLIFHNVFSLSKPKSFDLGNYPKGDARYVTFTKPGIVYVNCHLHPNMAGTVVVTPNQWNAKADEKGDFSISGVPPGDYTVVAWHKTAGYFRKSLRVSSGQDTAIGFFIPLEE